MTDSQNLHDRGAYGPGLACPAPEGIDDFIADVSHLVTRSAKEGRSTAWFVRRSAERYSYICMNDLRRPTRFLRQMAGAPQVQFGTTGFRQELVDDLNPARHYMAFLWLGYWLPYVVAIAMLWAWETAGFVRYRGNWSWPDIANGEMGIHHGRFVRRYGACILPSLIARDLTDHNWEEVQD